MVSPSQALSNTPHQPWAAIAAQGCAVACSHCTCAAGLGEVCNHVAGLLQALLCLFYLFEGVFTKVADMGVVMKEKLLKVKIPSKEDIFTLLSKLSEMPGDPAGILLVTESSSNYIPPALKITLSKPLGVLFKMDNIGKSLPELRDRSLELYNKISVTLQQREAICSLTANQRDSKY
ncbi:Uncharacterized protein APZ42_014052 [Daphnia magna]|uniref:SWIM-type domain-containing protein n=1 Tax=Daphnia magna TaxID=35525 RepID=A0A162QAJ6_9CRUS|nr:Uncharacterized protein APZ42_014052 [Daphnia magna]